MSEPRRVGSAWSAAPTSLYTPGSRDSSALSIIPAKLTRTRVTVSGPMSFSFFIHEFLEMVFTTRAVDLAADLAAEKGLSWAAAAALTRREESERVKWRVFGCA